METRLRFQLTQLEVAVLELLAAEEGVSAAEFIRTILMDHVANERRQMIQLVRGDDA